MNRPLIIGVLSALLTSTAVAQEPVATEDIEKKLTEAPENGEKPKDGWSIKANVGLTGSWSNSKNVVGSDDGTTVQLGAVFGGTADWRSGQHAWENALAIQHGQTKTPQLDQFIKSADQLELKSTYLFSFTSPDWLGAFGRVKLNTQILPTDSVRANDTLYTFNNSDGTVDTPPAAVGGEAQRLLSAFEPMTLRETAGLFAKPFTEDKLTLKTSLGVGFQQIITSDGYVISLVSPATGANGEDEVTLDQLESSNDLGVEVTANATGIIVKELLNWRFDASLFQPVVTSSDTDLSGLDQLNAEVVAGLSLKLAKWLSLDYVLTARRVPLVLAEWQVLNQLLLNAGFDLL